MSRTGSRTPTFPFTALVGADELTSALLLSAISPEIGGVLVRGEKGTAKSTMVRALAQVLPAQEVVTGCRFGCAPGDGDDYWPGAGDGGQQAIAALAQLVGRELVGPGGGPAHEVGDADAALT